MNKLSLFQKGDSRGFGSSKENSQFTEIFFYAVLVFIGFFTTALILRLIQLTVVKGQYYHSISENNRIKEFIIEAKRGEILDRKGFTIVRNLDVDIETPIDQIIKNDDRIVSRRVYETPEAIAHLVGYRQLADQKDLKQDNCDYKLIPGDKVGKKGVEKIFDCLLKGKPGKKLIEVDAAGKYLKTISVIPPVNGQNIRLSIDWELQKKAHELLENKKGAIIASIPKTGEILALASSPSYNPEDFENQRNLNLIKYIDDENKPLFNRATEGVYPPGSIFKLITATAALEEKAVDEFTLFEDKGTITAGPITFGNWYFLQYGKTEGMVDLIKAIKRSNDIYFYLAGEKTGVDKIKKWADIFGFGKKTDLGFEESEGIIPSVFWKEETLKERWFTGDTYNLSIGQGYLSVTPIQILNMFSVFANNGYLCQPKLLKDEAPNCKNLPIGEKTIGLVREGMKQACSTGGTGWPLFNFSVNNSPIQTACKTGTAESHALSGLPHAWITVFAPFEKPEIALTVLVEEGGQGSDVAGPIAKELLNTYFERTE